MRSAVVKALAGMYIDRKECDLAGRPGVLKIHAIERCTSIAESLKSHVSKRVDALYPASVHVTESGALLPGLEELVRSQLAAAATTSSESAFDMKQSTMHDSSRSAQDLFTHVRPSIVCDEGESAGTFAPEVVAEHAMKNVLNLTVRMSNEFEEQFVSKTYVESFRGL